MNSIANAPVVTNRMTGALLAGNIRRADPQVYKFVPVDGVGALVQSCLRAGMKKIMVVPNKNGGSCTLTIES